MSDTSWTCPRGPCPPRMPGCCEQGRPDCHDCGAQAGGIHDDGCDVARCLHTGQQRLACRMFGPLLGQEPHDCGRDAWLGYDPDQRQAALHGLWVYCPPYGSPVRCDADHPGAISDVTRLMRNGMWDRERKTWMLLDGAPL